MKKAAIHQPAEALRPKRRARVKTVAMLLAVSVPTVWRWAKVRPDFPKPTRQTASVTTWSIDEIEAWAAQPHHDGDTARARSLIEAREVRAAKKRSKAAA
jgi:predicted DNA-binding transcriptional regulator AlpA